MKWLGIHLVVAFIVVVLFQRVYSQIHNSNTDILDKQINGLRRQLKNTKEKDGNKLILADTWRKLGIMLQSKDIRHHQGGGKLQPEALDAFNNALRLDEGKTMSLNIQVNYLKGILLKMMGFGEESLQCLDRSLSYKLSSTDKSSVYFHKGESHLMLGKIQDAADNYRKAIKLAPCKTDRYYSYVQACRELKTMKKEKWLALMNEMREVMKTCLSDEELNVDFAAYDSLDSPASKAKDLGSLTGFNDLGLDFYSDDEEEEDYSLQNHLQFGNDDINVENSAVYWALYIVAEKTDRYSLAWWYLEKANALEKSVRELKYRQEDTLAQRGQITGIFTKGFWDTLPDMSGDSSTVPIFIVGMMRSGSTLLETMLDSHHSVWGMGEDSLFNGNLTHFRDALVQASSSAATGSHGRVAAVIREYGDDTAEKMVRLATAKIGSDKDKSRQIKHVVDKMLFNYRNIGFIHLVYPNALIIHTVRDPLDTLFSCYRNKFDDFGLEWSLDVSDLALQYSVYLEIMAHFRKVLPGRVIDLRYEELVTNPEATMRHLIVGRLGLKWDPNILNFHSNNRTVHTHSQSQVRQSIYKHSVGSWRRYAQQLQPMIDELNRYLPKLRKNKALPFADTMNWGLDPLFDYEALIEHSAIGGSFKRESREQKREMKTKKDKVHLSESVEENNEL